MKCHLLPAYLLLASIILLTSNASTDASTMVTFPISGEVLDPGLPVFGETGSGSVTYDSALITGVGEETITADTGGLTLEFTFLSQTFFETDDIDFPAFPELDFVDGVPTEVDFVVSEFDSGDNNPVEIADPRITEFFILEITAVPGGGFFAEIFTSAIPEPASFGLALIAVCLGHASRRR